LLFDVCKFKPKIIDDIIEKHIAQDGKHYVVSSNYVVMRLQMDGWFAFCDIVSMQLDAISCLK